MKRVELKALGLNKNAIDEIMKLHNTNVIKHKKDLEAKNLEIIGLKINMEEMIEELNNKIVLIKKWKAKYYQDIANLKKENEINLAIARLHPRNEKTIIGFIDKNQIEFKEDGSLNGLQEQLESIKKDNSYLFKENKPLEIYLDEEHGNITLKYK